MRLFVGLCQRLERPLSTEEHVQSIIKYFQQSSDQDILWATSFLTNQKSTKFIKNGLLRKWAEEQINLPEWLIDASYDQVGDPLETISILVSSDLTIDQPLVEWMESINSIKKRTEEESKIFIFEMWSKLSLNERYLFNKILTGGLRIKIDLKIIVKALATYLGREEYRITEILSLPWRAEKTSFDELFVEVDWNHDISKSYPFCSSKSITDIGSLGESKNYFAEWAYPGIDAQIIIRDKEVFIWSSEGELLTQKFPEFGKLEKIFNQGLVIEGKIVSILHEEIQPYQKLRKRLTKKSVTKQDLMNIPAIFIVSDILELGGSDLRNLSFLERRGHLKSIVKSSTDQFAHLLYLSETIEFTSWESLDTIRKKSRTRRAKGILLYTKNEKRAVGETHERWIWRPELLLVNAILLYAQKGQGRSSSQYEEFTFAVKEIKGGLIPICKTVNNLTQEDSLALNVFIKKNTIERFGPVRSIRPELVFQLSFSDVYKSRRPKSGIMLENPQILSWEKDRSPEQVATLSEIVSLLN